MVKHQEFKQTETGRLPKEWEVGRINKVFDVYGGTTPSTSNKEYWNGEILWVTPTDITQLNGNIYLDETEKRITDKAVKECSLSILQNDTILLTSRATIGFTAINAKPVTINKGMTALIPKGKNKVYSLFYAYYFQLLKPYLEQLGAGSTFKEVSKSTIKNVYLPLLPIPEQKKIAEILSTVDEAIEKVDEAIEKTQRLKKGLMQELLTRGIGHKEFKDTETCGELGRTIGRVPQEWEVVKVKNIGEVLTGKTPSTNNKMYWNGGIPFITPVDIQETKYVYKTQRFVTQEGTQQIGYVLPKDTVLVVCIGATIGKTAITYTESITNQQINAIICSDKINPHYAYYAITLRNEFLKLSSGVAAVPIIKKSLFEQFKLPLPPLAEQKKIAEILSTVDNRVELLRKKKEKLERVKKGLMNDLLSGKRRVINLISKEV
ncbi:MAG: restriction endonuclease subunit S [Deltaproteobacteria bacterium]|nr:restriction endonuclease subunit S [Deltaproteobacteria bacterium]